MSRDPLDMALAGLEEAARELATQCYQWDQLARELWEELDRRYVAGGPNDWMGYYVERLRRYAPEEPETPIMDAVKPLVKRLKAAGYKAPEEGRAHE